MSETNEQAAVRYRRLYRETEERLEESEKARAVAEAKAERYSNLLKLIRGDLENLAPELMRHATEGK